MQLLTMTEVCKTYRISRSSLLNWEEKGILKNVVRLPGAGHRRYLESEIHQLLGLAVEGE